MVEIVVLHIVVLHSIVVVVFLYTHACIILSMYDSFIVSHACIVPSLYDSI
jgi:hypothetical protein